MEAMLEDTFRAFTSGTPEMEGRAFVKCMRDAGLMDKQLQVVDVDLIFAKCKPKGGRKIDFIEFQDCLAMVADKKRISDQDVIDAVCCAAGPSYETKSSTCSATFETSGIGPERFYYDRSTYTGTHRHGGPKTYGDIVTDSSLVDRAHELDDALHRKKADRGLPTLLGAGSTMAATSSRDMKEAGSVRLRQPRSPQGTQRSREGDNKRRSPRGGQPTAEPEAQKDPQQLERQGVQQGQMQQLQLPLPPAVTQHQAGYPAQAVVIQPQRYTYANQLPVAGQITVVRPATQAPVQHGYPQASVAAFAGSHSSAPAAWVQPRFAASVAH